MRNGFLLREDEWAYIQYGENGGKGIELYNIKRDPHQYTNLAQNPAHRKTLDRFKSQMTSKLQNIRNNDLKGY
jgi:iduronate 2-sulfatase